ALLYGNDLANGTFSHQSAISDNRLFANLISVSFSAFDNFENFHGLSPVSRVSSYNYIGIKILDLEMLGSSLIKSTSDLCDEFTNAVYNIRSKRKNQTWRKAIDGLGSDPNFKNENFEELVEIKDKDFAKAAKTKFTPLSSGHKIVLLTITSLINVLE